MSMTFIRTQCGSAFAASQNAIDDFGAAIFAGGLLILNHRINPSLG
jgi:hypothetical protein